METEAAFLATMAADPENNLPRLVFADWLEEQGDPDRAELIRLQCEPELDDRGNAQLEALLERKSRNWLMPFHLLDPEILFRRGFPYHLKADFVRIVEFQHLLTLAPEWHLSPTRPDWDFEPRIDLCEQFVNGPHVDRIRGLNLAWAGWDPEELATLLTPPLLGRLRELRFGDTEGDAEFRALHAAEEFHLEALGFGGDSYGIGDVGLAMIASDYRYGSLRILELPNNALTEEGITTLAGSPHLTQLRGLDLGGGSNSSNEIGPDGASAIADSENFEQLENLDLAVTGIEDDGFISLVTSPHLPNLKVLNVPGNGITNTGLVELANSDAVPKLQYLNVCSLGDSRITVAGLRAIVESARMETLTALRFSGARFRDEGADLLAQSPACRNLEELYLGGCGISAEGYARLLESPNLRRVRQFNLNHTGLSKAKIRELRQRFGERVQEPNDYT